MLGLPLSKLNSVSNFLSKQKRSKKGFVGFVVSIYTIHTLSQTYTHTQENARTHTVHEIRAYSARVRTHVCALMEHYTKQYLAN